MNPRQPVDIVVRILRRLVPSEWARTRWPGVRGLPASFQYRFIRPLHEWAVQRLAVVHRHRLGSVTIVGVTGSAGKTTAKDMIAAVLGSLGPGLKSPHTANMSFFLAQTILRTRPRHRFCILELSGHEPGALDYPLRAFRPMIGVVTTIGSDHMSNHGSRESIVAEKGKLVAALPRDGVAVLNADDEHVLAMASRSSARVITYGVSASADLRAENVSASWPDRLTFTARFREETCQVETRLCGAHWLPSVLSALATGLAVGVTLQVGARAVATVEPFQARMSPVEHPDGVVFIRDDVKAPLWSLTTSLDFMRAARATRKIAVFGTLSDFAGAERGYLQAARQALGAVDHALFVGRWAPKALKARRHPGDEAVQAFATVEEVSRYLDQFLRPGDLVLIKGSNTADHLVRIPLARTTTVRCWRSDCRKLAFCNTCSLLEVPARDSGAMRPAPAAAPVARADPRGATGEVPAAIIVGFGNPGERYRDTPHNIGQRVLDEVARRFGIEWVAGETAWLADGEWKGVPSRLLKLTAFVNDTGPALGRLAEQLGFGAAQCILVYDDLSLPLGSVRARMHGSDGGHRGVRSVLLTFQTEAIRRIKIGTGRPGDKGHEVQRVLSPFSASERPTVDRACAEAADRLLEMVARSASTVEP